MAEQDSLVGRIFFDNQQWALANAPYIGTTQTWWVFDGSTYVDTGVKTTVKGEKGYQGVSISGAQVNALGKLVLNLTNPDPAPTTPTPATLTTTASVVSTIEGASINADKKLVFSVINAPGTATTNKVVNTQPIVPTALTVNADGTLTFNYGDTSSVSTPGSVFATIDSIAFGTGAKAKTLIFTVTEPNGVQSQFEVAAFQDTMQGYSLGELSIYEDTSDNNVVKYQAYLNDPDHTAIGTPEPINIEAGKVNTVNEIEPETGTKNIVLTASDIPMTSDAGSESISTKLNNMATVSVKTGAPTASATAQEKLGLWVDRTTGLPYVWDSVNSVWITLGAVWK